MTELILLGCAASLLGGWLIQPYLVRRPKVRAEPRPKVIRPITYANRYPSYRSGYKSRNCGCFNCRIAAARRRYRK